MIINLIILYLSFYLIYIYIVIYIKHYFAPISHLRQSYIYKNKMTTFDAERVYYTDQNFRVEEYISNQYLEPSMNKLKLMLLKKQLGFWGNFIFRIDSLIVIKYVEMLKKAFLSYKSKLATLILMIMNYTPMLQPIPMIFNQFLKEPLKRYMHFTKLSSIVKTQASFWLIVKIFNSKLSLNKILNYSGISTLLW